MRGKTKTKSSASTSIQDIPDSSVTEDSEDNSASVAHVPARVRSERRLIGGAVTVTEMGDFHSSNDINSTDSQQSDASEQINHLHHNPQRTKDVLK